ncbi:hypothetical protein [Hafnia paralvei]|uniref:hypothetical protein n=1 Tax=Hafnia paralvei TaxID=546367 RepID=UPI00300C785F
MTIKLKVITGGLDTRLLEGHMVERSASGGIIASVEQHENALFMNQITREELDSKLAQNKAEAEAIAAVMRADMAQWREQNNAQMSALQIQLSSLNSKIDGKFEGLEGKLDGLKTTSNTVQWMVGAMLALLALVAALPSIQDMLKPAGQLSIQQSPTITTQSQK